MVQPTPSPIPGGLLAEIFTPVEHGPLIEDITHVDPGPTKRSEHAPNEPRPLIDVITPVDPGHTVRSESAPNRCLLNPLASDPGPADPSKPSLDLSVLNPLVVDTCPSLQPIPLGLPHLATGKLLSYRQSLRLAAKSKGKKKSAVLKAQEIMCKKFKLTKFAAKVARTTSSSSSATSSSTDQLL